MACIIVLGAGVMGSAITVPMVDAGHEVRLVGTHLDANPIASIRQSRLHPRLKVHLPESVTPFTHDQLGEAMRGADLVILGVSSAGVDWAAERLRATVPPQTPVILLTKGLRETESPSRFCLGSSRPGCTPASAEGSVLSVVPRLRANWRSVDKPA